jgi:hypothetical protein
VEVARPLHQSLARSTVLEDLLAMDGMKEPSPLKAWPEVSTRELLCRDDRLIPAHRFGRVAEERLGIIPGEIDGGQCVALRWPKEPADRRRSFLL